MPVRSVLLMALLATVGFGAVDTATASSRPRAMRAALAALSTNSRHSIVAGAGDEIHLFEPSAVVAAVDDVVRAVRENPGLTRRQ